MRISASMNEAGFVAKVHLMEFGFRIQTFANGTLQYTRSLGVFGNCVAIETNVDNYSKRR